jgi:hypothetical protein
MVYGSFAANRRLMCGAYFLEDGKPLSHYHITEGDGFAAKV